MLQTGRQLSTAQPWCVGVRAGCRFVERFPPSLPIASCRGCPVPGLQGNAPLLLRCLELGEVPSSHGDAGLHRCTRALSARPLYGRSNQAAGGG